MPRLRLYLFLTAFILCGFFSAKALAMHAFSQSYLRTSQVVDNAKIMTAKVVNEMLEIADDTEYATGEQMILVTIPAMPKGWKPELYAEYAAKELGLGQPATAPSGATVQKPGVLMMVSKADEKVGFSLTTGQHRYLNGRVLASILANEVAPNVAQHDLQQAARRGFIGLSEAVQGGYRTPAEKRKQWLPFAILLPLVVLMQVLFGDGSAARFFGGGAWKRW